MAAYNADFVRGGTSKGLLIHTKDLPDREQWPALFSRFMGSPDRYGRQLDGMGGGISSLSKVCVVGPSARSDADVDYTFAQVQVDSDIVDFSGNCGNMASSIGQFAVRHALVAAADGEVTVSIHNTNTGKIIRSTFEVRSGVPLESGDLEIPGVSGSGAPIRLDFLDPGGAATGSLLPTGNPVDEIILADGSTIRASIVDAANGCVFVQAAELGALGNETPEEIGARPDLIAKLLEVRERAAVLMGIAESRAAARANPMIPLVAMVGKPCDAELLSGEQLIETQVDVQVRMLSSGLPHRAVPMTGGLCTTVAARMPGSVVHEVTRDVSQKVRVGTPSGVIVFDAVLDDAAGDDFIVLSGAIFRTSRLLFSGQVFE